ncbi:MAG: response regulator transcription factor, partial [Bacteroidota bacterium]
DLITPIIFLTAKSQTRDVVAGFEAGGNDYLRKPFSMEELIVRIKVMLSDTRLLHHAAQKEEETTFQLGVLYFDSIRQFLQNGEQTITLTARESELLKLFCQNKNKLLSKQTILLKIWGNDSFFNSRSMDVFVSKLRKHLRIVPNLEIMNVRGSGYKLVIK